MRYACQVWGLCDNVACHRISTLQKCGLRLITFSAPRTPNPIFSDLEFLNFSILLKSWTFFLFINFLMSISLKISWTPLILAKSVIHSMQGGHAWAFLNSLQLTPKLHSFSRLSIQQWNHLQQSFPNINLEEISYSNLKYLARKFYLEKYMVWILNLSF